MRAGSLASLLTKYQVFKSFYCIEKKDSISGTGSGFPGLVLTG